MLAGLEVRARSESIARDARLPARASTDTAIMRRLHFVGACFRVPGVHYCEYEVLGSEAPSPGLYDAICQDCWNDEEEAGEAEDSADEVSSLLSEE